MGILDFIKNTFSGSEKSSDKEIFADIIEAAYEEMKTKGQHYWAIKTNESEVFVNRVIPLTDKQKAAFIAEQVRKIHKSNEGRTSLSTTDKAWQQENLRDAYMRHLLKMKIALDDDDIETIVSAFTSYYRFSHNLIFSWPVGMLVSQVEKQIKERALSEKLRNTLMLLRARVNEQKNAYYEKEQSKVLAKIDHMLFQPVEGADAVKPTFFPGDDDFGKYANETINKLSEADKPLWFKLMIHSQKATGGKPSNKYLEESKVLFKEFGTDKFKLLMNEWISFLTTLKERTDQHTHQHNGTEYTFTTTELLSSTNQDMIKGFVWMCVHFHDKSTLFNIAALAERSYRKIPNKGPAAAAIGNACIYVLAHVRGLDGVGHLSRLRMRIKQSSTQNLIEKYLNQAAAEQGVSIHEIEDMAVDDYGLENARKEFDFDGYKAILEITGVGKTELNWFKTDGSPQKSVPAFIKQKHAAKFKKIKDRIKQIEITVSAQRDRIDRMFKSNRSMDWAKFNEFYFAHGLMSFLARRIIWNFSNGEQKQAAFFLNGTWCNNKGEAISSLINDTTMVSLWHPVFHSVEQIKDWREFMMNHQIVQPLKQAFREVYLLTDAEINTVTYSNRMAAHLLKQHQFNSLAKIRGWKYSLMGGFDNGALNSMASIDLTDYDLRGEFWINEINSDDAMTEIGIWLYISTDQVRFTNISTGNVVELLEVPPIVLSEVMRDVDLFVGVASVGNDPAWRDSGGLPAYRDYWQSYSFGELTELAKTRKSILERLLPRLKVARVAELKDKFLVIKGTLRTYKIHIGSTNILMEPNDQYLCIVPDRGQKVETETVFLPFEGDSGLSIILSKALLLASDDKITDPTIIRQIKQQ